MTWRQTGLNDAFGFELAQDNMRRIGERHWVGADTTRFYYYDDRRLIRYEDWEFDSSGCEDDGDVGHLCVDENKTFSDSVHYAFDLVGNRTDHSATITTGNRLTAYDGYTLVWDDAGFLTSKTGNGLTQNLYWNARGQLDSVSTNGTVTRFAYDGLGRRVKKDDDGTVTQYVHDGDDVLMELDGSFGIEAEYTHYPGTDRLHSMIRDSEVFYFATDEKGTVVGVMDTLGLVENQYRYDPWGLPEGTATEGVENPFRYIGREWDEETGLLLLRARYYDPEIGRFVSEDPIGLVGGINPFAYAAGDPVNLSDRTGLDEDQDQETCVSNNISNGGDEVCELEELVVDGGSWSGGIPIVIFGTGGGPVFIPADFFHRFAAGGRSDSDIVGTAGVSGFIAPLGFFKAGIAWDENDLLLYLVLGPSFGGGASLSGYVGGWVGSLEGATATYQRDVAVSIETNILGWGVEAPFANRGFARGGALLKGGLGTPGSAAAHLPLKAFSVRIPGGGRSSTNGMFMGCTSSGRCGPVPP